MPRNWKLCLCLLLVLAAGCEPPPKTVVEEAEPRELTQADMNYLRARGVRPEQYESEKARVFLKQRDFAIQESRKSTERTAKMMRDKAAREAAKREAAPSTRHTSFWGTGVKRD